MEGYLQKVTKFNTVQFSKIFRFRTFFHHKHFHYVTTRDVISIFKIRYLSVLLPIPCIFVFSSTPCYNRYKLQTFQGKLVAFSVANSTDLVNKKFLI